MTKVTYGKSSPYSTTQQVNDYLDYLNFWNGPFVPAANDDTLMTLDSKYNKRPDLLSFDLYDTPQLWWIFTMRNPDVIRDPIYDFLTGITIYTPSKSSLKRYI